MLPTNIKKIAEEMAEKEYPYMEEIECLKTGWYRSYNEYKAIIQNRRLNYLKAWQACFDYLAGSDVWDIDKEIEWTDNLPTFNEYQKQESEAKISVLLKCKLHTATTHAALLKEIERLKGGGWIDVKDRLPEPFRNDDTERLLMKPVLILIKKRQLIGYYFPDKFKQLEWEDWDEYKQEYFPWTTEDIDKGIVWANTGWYHEAERDGEIYWEPIDTATHWQPLPAQPETK